MLVVSVLRYQSDSCTLVHLKHYCSLVPSTVNTTVNSLMVLLVTWSIGSLSEDSSTHLVPHGFTWSVSGFARCPVLPHIKHLAFLVIVSRLMSKCSATYADTLFITSIFRLCQCINFQHLACACWSLLLQLNRLLLGNFCTSYNIYCFS